MARKTRQVETRMVSEYLLANYANVPTIQKQPLGSLPAGLVETNGYRQAIGVMRPFRPEVDAIAIYPRYLVLIEAKVWQVVNGLGKLPLYKSLVPETPELQQYQGREILLELVVGWTYANLETMARAVGVRVRVYCPDWLNEVVEGMHRYWTADYRREREAKLRTRELLGLE